jgi:predicted nuclease of predicted toxin-antitoxin system
VDLGSAQDLAILDWAAAEHRHCVTLDADFHALMALGARTRPSVVRIRIEGLKGVAVAALLETLWERAGAAIERGALVTVTPASIRVRNLPLVRP